MRDGILPSRFTVTVGSRGLLPSRSTFNMLAVDAVVADSRDESPQRVGRTRGIMITSSVGLFFVVFSEDSGRCFGRPYRRTHWWRVRYVASITTLLTRCLVLFLGILSVQTSVTPHVAIYTEATTTLWIRTHEGCGIQVNELS